MKLYLFGGAEIGQGQVAQELKLIEKVLRKIRPKQILHVPFARTIASEKEWSGDWYHRHISVPGAEYLNAKKPGDITKARSPLIFISGGSRHLNLIKKVTSNKRLLQLIKNADYYVGESAGSMFAGEYFRGRNSHNQRQIMKGLGIVKKTFIIPHFSQRKLQSALPHHMKQTKATIGVGIDSVTALAIDTKTWPKKYKVIGKNKVKIIK